MNDPMPSGLATRPRGLDPKSLRRSLGLAATVVLAGGVVAAIAFGSGRNEQPQEPAPAAAAGEVELTPEQLRAIKIEPAGTYRFTLVKDAVGNISLEQDPAIVQADSALVAAAANFELTSRALARATDLYGANGGVAQKELEQATSDQETSAAALKAAREAAHALGETDAAIDEMVATKKLPTEDAKHAAGTWLLADVAESDSPLIRTGQPVEIHTVAFPDKVFHGSVSKVYATVDPNTHRVAVRCRIDDPVEGLRPGMLASAGIQVQAPVESVAVPFNGVVREGDGSMTVWVTSDRRHFSQRLVVAGQRADGRVQVLKGLQAGELVVSDGAIFLDNMLQAPADD